MSKVKFKFIQKFLMQKSQVQDGIFGKKKRQQYT